MQVGVSIKNIRKIQLKYPQKVYCVTLPTPNKILIQPKNSIVTYGIYNCNFGLMFGMSFKKFSSSVLEVAWSYDRIKSFIAERDLQSMVVDMQQKYPNLKKELWEYYSVAKFMRDSFFETYKGLMKRIKRNEKLGKDVGYVRSYHGGIRRVPLLSLATIDGRWRKDEDIKGMANLVNITSNSNIQTDESVVMAMAALKWNSEENQLREYSKIIGFVHDSADMYADKDRILDVVPVIKMIFEKEEAWQQGIKFLVDMQIADFEDSEQYYKHGVKLEKFMENECQ